jgi:ATP-dependent RNA helicase DDX52/ROK1
MEKDSNKKEWTPMTVEEASVFRKQQKIKIYGQDVPNPFRAFDELFSKYVF